MSFAAGLVQDSYVVCCRSCSGKLCRLLQVVFRKAVLFIDGLVPECCFDRL